jgi:N-acetylneuraminic acid mutarotase
MVTGALLAFVRPDAPVKDSQRALTFAERVIYQRAIEEVYWRHRIWPTERSDPKPSLDVVMSQAQIEKKVEDYLHDSQALEDYWQRPITAEQLQGEMDRMAQHTRQPEVLCELFAALENDPFVIAECLARPTLAERLLRDVHTYERQVHAQARGSSLDLHVPPAPLGSGPARVRSQLTNPVGAQGSYRLPTAITSNSGGRYNPQTDSWLPTNNDAPTRRAGHTAIWTGTEMIVWGGYDETNYLNTNYLNTGAIYNPVTDSWIMTSTVEAPAARAQHTAVWTGSEMIIWGGYDGSELNTGARYNPSTNTWTVSNPVNAPSARSGHTAVWTGSEMIVWGGGIYPSYYDTGGRYNPGTDTWTATSQTNVPVARTGHTAVWTGTEMIVWGGYFYDCGGGHSLNTGARYDPAANTWTATSTTNAPAGRSGHTAIWTGSQMIVWGSGPNTGGGRYNPATDSWTATSTANAPTARSQHTAVWTGSEMIVWGGSNNSYPYYANTGGRYNPDTDSWVATSTASTPGPRAAHSAVWSGKEMIVWGGYFRDIQTGTYTYFDNGGRYDPKADNWTATGGANRTYHKAVWTGSEMIVWGGTINDSTGGRYNPTTDSWLGTSTINAPSARYYHTAVWTGTEMIVWGGYPFGSGFPLNTGGRYNPGTDSWVATTTTNAPEGRASHTAVWSGTEMIVWGGETFMHFVNTGGRYNPNTDTWAPTSTANAAGGRVRHTAVWSGNEMIVWGGALDGFDITATGGRYDPSTDTWMATNMSNVPDARYEHTAVWTGNEMIVWGGTTICPPCYSYTGGRYNPDTDSWTPTSITNAPSSRYDHTAVWTGNEMIVWGGSLYNGGTLNTGGKYSPSADSWASTSVTSAPAARSQHTAVWTGVEMIVWGGVVPEPTPTPTATPTATPTTPPPTPTATFTPTSTPTATPTPTSTAAHTPTPTPTATHTPTPTPTATSTPTPTPTPTATPAHPSFFSGEIALQNGVYYLQFPNGTPFGYYSYLTDPHWIYHFDMGYEYWFDANDAQNGIYFYDLMSNHFFYTSPSFPFPYLYDFSLNTVLYYFPDPNRPDHYTTNPRYFYNFATGQIITM